MLADASISRAGVSKAKPQCAARPAIGADARRPAAAQRGRQVEVAAEAWHTGRAGRLVRSCRYHNRCQGRRRRRRSWRRRAGGWRGRRVGEMRIVGEGGESGRRCASGRGAASGRCVSVRGGRRRGRARQRRERTRHVCRGGASRRGGAARREGRRVGEEPLIGEGHFGDGRVEERRQ
jgi:hypothetical protein